MVDLTIPSRGSRGFDVPTRQARLHSRMSTAVTAVAREGDRSEATGSLWARDTARRAPYRQPVGWRRDPSPLRRSAAASASLSTSSRSPAEDLLPRWEQAWCESRTSSARPAEHQNRRVHRLARCRKRLRVAVSSVRRGLIGPGAAPSSVGAGLGGSAKPIRPFRRELRPF